MFDQSEKVEFLPERRKANKAEVAEFFGVSLPTVDAWVRNGCPVVNRGMRGQPWVLDLLAIAQWRYAANENLDDFDPDRAQPKDRKDWFASELHRRQLQQRDRQLIPAEEVERGLASLVQHLVRSLDTLGDLLERDCGISGEAVVRVQRAADAIREDMYKRLTTATDAVATDETMRMGQVGTRAAERRIRQPDMFDDDGVPG